MSSEVWSHFKRIENSKAICKKCPKILSCKGSSTSSLINHLRGVHKINLTKRSRNPDCEEATTSGKNIQTFNTKKETIGEIFARCAAEDGMSIRSIKNSRVVKFYLNSKKFQMPCETTIWAHIDKFFNEKHEEFCTKFMEIKNQFGKFSILVDEWTDRSCYKYVNVTIKHFNSQSSTMENYNLGIEQIKDKATASNLKKIITDKLSEFSLDISSDIVASTHDGAAVMKKYGNIINPESQLFGSCNSFMCCRNIIFD